MCKKLIQNNLKLKYLKYFITDFDIILEQSILLFLIVRIFKALLNFKVKLN